jgi:hypothetical protein
VEWNVHCRIAFNIVHCGGDAITAKFVAEYANAMLQPPRYLSEELIAADVQLHRQFVFDFERGYGNGLSDYVDRHTSYDILLKLIADRFVNPVIVETGCIRAKEDWRGAGSSTYLMGVYVERAGGEVHSVDISADNCKFASSATTELRKVTIYESDSVVFLSEFEKPIDVLLLDSMDTEAPEHADHAVRELEAAMPHLHPRSVIIFDDTVYRARSWTGKGSKAVPILLDAGWKIVYSGYQTILTRVNHAQMID